MDINSRGKLFPKGFHVKRGVDLHSEIQVLAKLSEFARAEGVDIARLPYVNFFDLASRGANIVGDRAFVFSDRKGRRLLLNSDALAPLMQDFLTEKRHGEAQTFWISPTFRYRNTRSRYFSQIGIAHLRFSHEEFQKKFCSNLNLMLEFLGSVAPGSVNVTITRPQKRLFLDEPDFLRLCAEIEDVCAAEGVRCLRDFARPNCDEILSDIGLIFSTPSGLKLGDGGSYSTYARAFCESVDSMISFCTGIEALVWLMDGANYGRIHGVGSST
jgi:hypothetical protein